MRTVWRVRWYDELGAERSKSFDKATDAKAFEGKVRTLKRAGDLGELDAGLETLAEFADEWWRLYAASNLERATLLNYSSMWNNHALPRLGHRRLRDLTPQVIVAFRAELEADGVGHEAIRKTMAMLQGMLQRAVEWQRIRSNPVKVVRKPPAKRLRAVRPLAPLHVEQLRKLLLDDGRLRDATLVSVLAYAGVRPQEALALTWRHVRPRTLLIEQAVSDGELKEQKNRRPPRTVSLLAPLRRDLAELRLAAGRPSDDAYVFAGARGGPWTEHDWRNWRRRVYAPAAEALGIAAPRPYDLRHSFASLLIHEGRLSIVELAHQLGHNPNVCLSTYAHVMAELDDARGMSAEEQIQQARSEVGLAGPHECGPNAAQDPVARVAAEPENEKTPAAAGVLDQALCRTRTGDPFLTMEVLYQLS